MADDDDDDVCQHIVQWNTNTTKIQNDDNECTYKERERNPINQMLQTKI